MGSGTTLAFAGLVSAKNYQDLIAWKRAMDLVETVYRESVVMPADERFGLTAQMRRAAVSVPANIAEGQGRRTRGEFLNHLSAAHGSVRELETHTILAGRLAFLNQSAVTAILAGAAEVGRLITGLANALNRQSSNQCV